jgi:hypothetical protein
MRRSFILVFTLLWLAASASAWTITFKDPLGDDDGPGAYVYPTDRVYLPGSFDLTHFTVKEQGGSYIFEITVNAKLENPWDMDTGFSIQMAEIYIDADGKAGSGHEIALPGMNAAFLPEAQWEKAVLVSPQTASRVKTEISGKAPDVAKDIIVPIKVTPHGKTIIAVADKKEFGIELTPGMGYQILVTSNEGFPDSNEILSRKVNEYEGQHRFGGGSDYSGDPHFVDMLYPPAQGGAAEITGQHACLSKYVSNEDPAKNVYVRLPVVRFGAASSEEGVPGKAAETAPPGNIPDELTPEARADSRAVGFASPPPEPRESIGGKGFGITWSGKIYTSWLYGNDVSEHSVYVDPFGDGGHNGINSELELNLAMHVSDYVEAGARIDSRFRKNYWATYWNNDDLDKAQYMKLRGVWVKFKTPEWISPFLESVLAGSSDLGMFSPWTVGRIRYIDRDNAMGTFLFGRIGSIFTYDLARISLPEPWAGPGWTTRGKGYYSPDGFFARDFAYALSMNFEPSERFRFRLLGDYTLDHEGDITDTNSRDGVDLVTRYSNSVGSGEFTASPTDNIELSGVYAYASSIYRDPFDYLEKKHANPVPQKDTKDSAMKFLAEFTDPFGVGLNLAVEYFNIGDDYVTLMGARRETDVLLTEGFESDDAVGAFDWGGWWGAMGQVPSLNVDNYDTQFDETCYQTIVGWKGETAVVSWSRGGLDLSGEATWIGYNTDMQGRDMGVYYDGGGFGAPGNAYNAFQDRKTAIQALKGSFAFQAGKQWDLNFRIKHIDDRDKKDLTIPTDDYKNNKWVYDFSAGCRIFDELYLKAGYTRYDKELTFGDTPYDSLKNRYYAIVRYELGGVRIGYSIEKFEGSDWAGDWTAGDVARYDDWNLVRSHAFLELAF